MPRPGARRRLEDGPRGRDGHDPDETAYIPYAGSGRTYDDPYPPYQDQGGGPYDDEGYARTDDWRRREPEDDDSGSHDVYVDRGRRLPPPHPPVRPGPGRPRRRPRYALRRIVAVLGVLVLAYVAAMVWAVASIWSSIEKVDATPQDASARPSGGAGSNFLLVGTDGREELSADERRELVTGSAEGTRADTLMLLHVGAGGPTLVSIPRDSYVDIPGGGTNKINAAYAQGGPELLVDTVEQATGLRVDGYLEIGFGGFVEVVETVGGVRMCLDEPVQDKRTRLDLPAGCQQLAGAEALNYVRMRYSDPRGDLGRVERQREFLAALADRLATPSTVLVPWRLQQVGTATGQALTIGDDTSPLELGRTALAMRTLAGGGGQSLTVPVADANYATPAGSAVLWDEARATELWEALRTGSSLTIEP